MNALTPTTQQVRDALRVYRVRPEEFDRWLAAHDEEVAGAAKASVFAQTQWPRWVDESREFSMPLPDGSAKRRLANASYAEVKSLADAWLNHQGYDAEQIAEGESATHKASGCEVDPAAGCYQHEDENGASLHPMKDLVDDTWSWAAFAVEHVKASLK